MQGFTQIQLKASSLHPQEPILLILPRKKKSVHPDEQKRKADSCVMAFTIWFDAFWAGWPERRTKGQTGAPKSVRRSENDRGALPRSLWYIRREDLNKTCSHARGGQFEEITARGRNRCAIMAQMVIF